jgi:ABC-type multidrug transport system fused ATPase/permease subunit
MTAAAAMIRRAHAQRLSPDFLDRRHLGDLMVRLTEDVAVIEGVASSGVGWATCSGRMALRLLAGAVARSMLDVLDADRVAAAAGA